MNRCQRQGPARKSENNSLVVSVMGTLLRRLTCGPQTQSAPLS
jgi:hypothetical protein